MPTVFITGASSGLGKASAQLFAGRSLQLAEHPAYAPLQQQQLASQGELNLSSAEAIAEVVYQAATDEQDQLRYLAGPDAVDMYAHRLAVGPEAFRQGVAQQFGLPQPGPAASAV